ncbi:MAG: hypothetical protein JNM81_02030 [Rhodospirillaceae bacterium]|nr:hypothetical protein [Rhodospirillaceae bacterium]
MALPPPALNSAVFAHHAPNADPKANDEASQAVIGWGQALERAYTSIMQAHTAHMANPMYTHAANLKRSADYAAKVMRNLLDITAPHSNAIDRERARITEISNAPLLLPQEPGAHYSVTAQQIREYFRNLSDEERLTRSMRAAQDGDTVTLGALLNAPGYLSGMDHVDAKTNVNQQELLRQTYRRNHFGAELERFEKLDRCSDMITSGLHVLQDHVRKLHPEAEIAKAVKLDKAARDASALAEKYL